MVNRPDGDQFHFDPATDLERIREEVPAYEELQDAVAEPTADIHAERVLELGVGTGQTSRPGCSTPPRGGTGRHRESPEMLTAVSEDAAADLRVSRPQDHCPRATSTSSCRRLPCTTSMVKRGPVRPRRRPAPARWTVRARRRRRTRGSGRRRHTNRRRPTSRGLFRTDVRRPQPQHLLPQHLLIYRCRANRGVTLYRWLRAAGAKHADAVRRHLTGRRPFGGGGYEAIASALADRDCGRTDPRATRHRSRGRTDLFWPAGHSPGLAHWHRGRRRHHRH
jgi:hypothetical protein